MIKMPSLSRDKADTLLLLVACALVLLPHVGHLPFWEPLICTVLLGWRGWITFHGHRMPPRVLLLPMAVLAMGGVYADYRTFFGRDTGVAMLVLLLSFKLLEMRAKRDLFVVILLSFFLMLANFFYSQTIGTALLMVLTVVVMLTTQLSFQYTGAVPPLKSRLRLGASIVAMAIPVTLILFVLFPRIQGPLWGLPGDANAGHTGLSDTMAPGNIAKLAQSDEIAFRVKFIDPPPPQAKRYWRGVVLGRYDGRTWMRRAPPPRADWRIVMRRRGAPLRHQVTMEPSGRRWLFALELPTTVPQMADNPAHFSPDMQLLTEQPINQRVRYDAASYTDFDMQPNASPAVLRDWLELPIGYNPRTLEFATRLHDRFNNNTDIANAVLNFFHNEKFSYTLEPPLLGVHAVDEFLFSTRAGFCEHYAGAFVVLMRAAGIPARVVTGYQGGDINPVDGYMTIRQSDAHAWAEIWLENRGWVRVDPTAAVAPERVERNLATVIPRRAFGGLVTIDAGHGSWLSAWRLNWDAVTNGWNQWVLNYTSDKQRDLLRSLGLREPDWRALVALMFAFGSLVMIAIAYPLIRNRQKRDPLEALYATLCEALARRGLPRQLHEGPQAYSARVTGATSPLSPERKTAIARFLKLYTTARYAAPGHLAPAAALSELKSLLVEC